MSTKWHDDGLGRLCAFIDNWLNKHKEHWRDAYLTAPHGYQLFIVKREPEINEDFEDQVSELDMTIANDPRFSDIRLDAMALPPASKECLASLIDFGSLVAEWEA